MAKELKTTINIILKLDDNNTVIGYELELPYNNVSELTELDEEIIESIRDEYFWSKGFKYDGRSSFDMDKTRKLKFRTSK